MLEFAVFPSSGCHCC